MRWTRMALLVGLAVLLGVVTPQESSTVADPAGNAIILGPPGRRIAARLFSAAHLSPHPRLVVVFHGDAPGHDPVYQYDFAQTLAAELTDTVVLAALRPGYSDGMGGHSDGDRGLATGDTYTDDAAAQLGQAVAEAAARLHARDVRLVGHSGGGALALIMLSQRPSLASAALIASCPCDLGRWRRHMALRDLNPLFLLPVRSVSPIARIGRLPRSLELEIMVGDSDTTAPPGLSRQLLASARAQGLRANLVVLPGMGHEILLTPGVLKVARELVLAHR